MAEVQVQATEAGLEAPKTEPQTPARPDHIPEKFWDAEKGTVKVDDLAKSYGELEKKQSAPAKTEEKTTAPTTEEKVTKAGLDLATIGKELLDNEGKLTDATVTKLKESGLDQPAIDAMVSGVKTKAEAIVAEITKSAGGADKLKDIYAWAEANLSEDEVAAYNSMLDGRNIVASKIAFDGLLARYNSANGSDPKLVGGEGTPSTSGVKPFDNTAQVTAAMRDPRYSKDEAYRKEVEARLAVSKVFG